MHMVINPLESPVQAASLSIFHYFHIRFPLLLLCNSPDYKWTIIFCGELSPSNSKFDQTNEHCITYGAYVSTNKNNFLKVFFLLLSWRELHKNIHVSA